MLSQFLSRYPSGNLISKLLQIYEGQFVLQVEVQVDGITRATGLAAAENLELAEDRARSRALMVLGIGTNLSMRAESKSVSPSTETEFDLTPMVVAPARWNGTKSLPTSRETQPDALTLTATVTAELEERSDRLPLTPVTQIQATGEALEEDVDLGNSFSEESSEDSMGALRSEVLPELYVEQSHREFLPEPEQVEPVATAVTKEPADMSHILAQTSIELQRLGWTTQKGRNYLKKTYGKASRQQLSELEIFEFLAYLKSQPTPKQLPLES